MSYIRFNEYQANVKTKPLNCKLTEITLERNN